MSFTTVAGTSVNYGSSASGSGTVLPMRFFVGSNMQAEFDDTASATSTVMKLVLNGTTYRVTVDNSDLGSGTKKYLYLV
jgi:hypothetical protein